jgi:hypothetical protein
LTVLIEALKWRIAATIKMLVSHVWQVRDNYYYALMSYPNFIFTHFQVAPLGKFVSLVGPVLMRVVWRFASVTIGEQCVTRCGMQLMLV